MNIPTRLFLLQNLAHYHPPAAIAAMRYASTASLTFLACLQVAIQLGRRRLCAWRRTRRQDLAVQQASRSWQRRRSLGRQALSRSAGLSCREALAAAAGTRSSSQQLEWGRACLQASSVRDTAPRSRRRHDGRRRPCHATGGIHKVPARHGCSLLQQSRAARRAAGRATPAIRGAERRPARGTPVG